MCWGGARMTIGEEKICCFLALAILEWFYLYKAVSEFAKSILWRIRFKHLNVLGEYAKNILPYIENTRIDIKN